ADRRGHPAQQGRNLRTRLGEAEDVVDEEEDVAALLVAEVFGHRQAGQAHALARAGRLVHLAEDEGGLLDDARFGHLVDEVVAFAAPLAHPGEDGYPGMLLGDVPDQLLDDDRLADAGAAEDPDLAALLERADEVDDLEAGLEDLDLGGLLVERRSAAVNGQDMAAVDVALAVDGPAEDVEDAAQGRLTNRDGDGPAGVADLDAASQAVGRGHGHGPDPVVAQVLLDLADERGTVLALDLDGVVDRRQLAGGELDVDDGTGGPRDPACRGRFGGSGGGHELVVSFCAGAQRAWAPEAISIISRVMLAWRTLL